MNPTNCLLFNLLIYYIRRGHSEAVCVYQSVFAHHFRVRSRHSRSESHCDAYVRASVCISTNNLCTYLCNYHCATYNSWFVKYFGQSSWIGHETTLMNNEFGTTTAYYLYLSTNTYIYLTVNWPTYTYLCTASDRKEKCTYRRVYTSFYCILLYFFYSYLFSSFVYYTLLIVLICFHYIA